MPSSEEHPLSLATADAVGASSSLPPIWGRAIVGTTFGGRCRMKLFTRIAAAVSSLVALVVAGGAHFRA
jgi:hypothetical protein